MWGYFVLAGRKAQIIFVGIIDDCHKLTKRYCQFPFLVDFASLRKLSRWYKKRFLAIGDILNEVRCLAKLRISDLIVQI